MTILNAILQHIAVRAVCGAAVLLVATVVYGVGRMRR